MKTTNRRSFLGRGLAASGILGAFSASSYSRVPGANERIHIGMLGSGWRSIWHIGWIYRTSRDEEIEVSAVCDIWNKRRSEGVAEVVKRFQMRPRSCQNYKVMLDDASIDAVIISTPDHQHCRQLIDSVQAGKDVYVEKPVAMSLQELNTAYDVVQASGRVVQNGTQGRSSRGAQSARAFIQSGRLGTVIRVEQSRSKFVPYWNHYPQPQSEAETNWPAFLANRALRPFDPDQHGHWAGYRDFSSGTIGGWMSHFSDFVHFALDSEEPAHATADGGIYSPTSEPQRTCPDTVSAFLHYREGFSTLYTTHFGNAANDYMIFFGTKGIMRVNDPDGNREGIGPVVSGEGSDDPERIVEEEVLDNSTAEDHMSNWVRCMRSREVPNAGMDEGYKQGIACILADRSLHEGCRMVFDSSTRTINPA